MPRAVDGRRAQRRDGAAGDADRPRPRRAGAGGLRDPRPLHRAGRGRGVLRPAAAGPDPRLHQAPAPARDRAGDRAGLHAVPAALAARRDGHQARGPVRAARRHRAAAGLRAGRRRLGELGPRRAGRRLPAGMARRAVPVRPGVLGPAVGQGHEPRRTSRGRAGAGRPAGPASPSRATPITLALRDDLPWLLRAARGDLDPGGAGPGRTPATSSTRCAARRAVPARPGRGDRPACRTRSTRRCGTAWPAAWSRPTASGPSGRCCGAAARSRSRSRAGCGAGCAAPRAARPAAGHCCRARSAAADRDELAEAVAEQLAARWGVVFRDLVARETLAVPWRDVLWAFRRMEARGTIRGGRFVTGFSGEQYAHPDAIDVLAPSASSRARASRCGSPPPTR